MDKKSTRTAKNTLKMDCATELVKICILYSGIEDVFTWSIPAWKLIHFFMNVTAMFVSEIRDSRCRSAGVMSESLGHVNLQMRTGSSASFASPIASSSNLHIAVFKK